MKRLACRVLGHAWVPLHYWPTCYSCRRCKEPGFWVPARAER